MTARKTYLPFGQPDFTGGEIDAVSKVLRSGWVGMGPETIAFEKELAEYTGAERIVTVNSCTSALFLSLLVKGIGPGDEVICPSLTWCSTANAALYLGAKVVFCDIDPNTLCMTPESVLRAVTSRTRAVMVVHMGGLTADVQSIRAALPEDIVLIEDAAHALGARYSDGEMVGSSGNLTCFSFYANKNLSTGEGGALAVDDPELAERFVSLRLHGLSSDAWKRFTHPAATIAPSLSQLGYKMNYTDLQASIGRVQLRRQGTFAIRRKEIARRYHEGLSHAFPELRFQHGILEEGHARHLFLVILPASKYFSRTRNDILLSLRERNIGASLHYIPLHTMPLYRDMERRELPHTEDVSERLLTLPIGGNMSDKDADDVLEAFSDILQASRR